MPRMPLLLLVAALAGMLGGGALIGIWALGCCLIADSVAVAVFVIVHDWPERRVRPGVHHVVPGQGMTLAEVFDRANAA